MKKGNDLLSTIIMLCIVVVIALITWLIKTDFIYIALIIAFSIMILKYATEKDKDENKEETKQLNMPKDIEIMKNKTNNNKIEKNIDNYDLEDWQKELVDDGSYEPYNFEEEELEDDDYYSEDDEE